MHNEKNYGAFMSETEIEITFPLPITRPRRLRSHTQLRRLVQENYLQTDDLVLPLFIREDIEEKKPIESMLGHYQLSIKDLKKEIFSISKLNIPAVLLFGVPKHKDSMGTSSCDQDGIIQKAIREIKENSPNTLVITDLCFCEYTDHGHCGIINHHTGKADVDNDGTLELLIQQAISHVEAGADVIAPSGMMDGMVGAIRAALDECGYDFIPILSYAVKYSSSLYGPFRDAAQGAPKFGNRQSYQMNYANSGEALREAELDIQEGADILMIKPASYYLDIISKIKNKHPQIPLAAYQVSGEFAMIKAAAEKGWIDEAAVAMESLLSIKRAGADFIITYFAKDIAKQLNS